MVEISKEDWKLYRERVPEWQEHYMEQFTKEYIDLLSGLGSRPDQFPAAVFSTRHCFCQNAIPREITCRYPVFWTAEAYCLFSICLKASSQAAASPPSVFAIFGLDYGGASVFPVLYYKIRASLVILFLSNSGDVSEKFFTFCYESLTP